jgi:DNA relaxase NicK
VAVGIDWLTITGPKSDLEDVTTELERQFGAWTSKGGKGFQRGGSRVFDLGVVISFDDPDKERPIIRVEVSGKALAGMEGGEVYALLRYLLMGRKCTRIDTRLDWQCPDGQRVGLIDLVVQSCRRCEQCHARRWKLIEDNDGVESAGHGAYLGKRGKDGSGRFVRVYDKGLETTERPAGTWERWEVEHSGDVANDVAVKIACDDDWMYTAKTIALGAVDFRENNGSRELARRPRVAWWEQVLDGVEPVTVREKRTATTFERWQAWLSRAAMPVMKSMAAQSGQTVGQVADDLFAQVQPHRDGERHFAVAGFLKQLPKHFAEAS